jgi:hypothetical protein
LQGNFFMFSFKLSFKNLSLMKKQNIILLLLAVILLQLSSCDNEIVAPESNEDSRAINSETTKVPNGRIDTNPLFWDVGEINHDIMPTPSGTLILTPWASGASRQISPDIIDDYRKSEGWVLLFNTFNSTTLPEHYFFILYNKYRGLIRMYYYIPSNANFINSANIVHTIKTEKSYSVNSKLLNFTSDIPIDFNSNILFGSTLENAQVAKGTWYAFEYEVAYDKNVVSQNYLTLSLLWNVRSVNITQLEISGTQSGTISGTSTTAIQKNNFDFINSAAADGAIKIGLSTAEFGKSIIKGNADANKFGQQVVSAVYGVVSAAKSGIIKNVISGIFGSSSLPNSQQINLYMDTRIKLSGTLTSNFLVASPGFAVPGYNQSNTSGYAPAYNDPLGVFYISAKPIVNVSKVYAGGGLGGGFGTAYWHYLSINNNSFQIDFNPALVGGNGFPPIATIQNIKKELVLLDPSTLPILEKNGIEETLINSNKKIISNLSYVKLPSNANIPNGKLGIRISFDVVPNNGAPKTRIAKTFLANVVY